MKMNPNIQPHVKNSLLRIASKANKTGSKTWFWSKNKHTLD